MGIRSRLRGGTERNSNEANPPLSLFHFGWYGDSNSQYVPRDTGCSQLQPANRTAMRDVPLVSARANAVRQKIQAGWVCVYNEASDNRGQRQKGPQFHIAPA